MPTVKIAQAKLRGDNSAGDDPNSLTELDSFGYVTKEEEARKIIEETQTNFAYRVGEEKGETAYKVCFKRGSREVAMTVELEIRRKPNIWLNQLFWREAGFSGLQDD